MRLYCAWVIGIFMTVNVWASPLPEDSIYQLDSQWTDQSGAKLKMTDMAGAPRLVVMLFTRCQSTCPLIVEEIRGVLKALPAEKEKDIRVTVFSFDSENETPETLADFVKKRKLDERWQLLTGKAEGVAELAAVLGVRYKKIKDEYVHSNILFFVDKNGVIKGKKDGLNTPKDDFVATLKKAL